MAMPEFKEVIQRVVDQNLSTIYIGKIEITKNSGELSTPAGEAALLLLLLFLPCFFRGGQAF